MFPSEWREFPSALCFWETNLMTTRVSVLLKSGASPDMLPDSICNMERLAIRHTNRPLFPTTISIPWCVSYGHIFSFYYLILNPTNHTHLLIFFSCILNPHNLVQLVIGHFQLTLNILSYPVPPITSFQIFSNFLGHSKCISQTKWAINYIPVVALMLYRIQKKVVYLIEFWKRNSNSISLLP